MSVHVRTHALCTPADIELTHGRSSRDTSTRTRPTLQRNRMCVLSVEVSRDIYQGEANNGYDIQDIVASDCNIRWTVRQQLERKRRHRRQDTFLVHRWQPGVPRRSLPVHDERKGPHDSWTGQ